MNGFDGIGVGLSLASCALIGAIKSDIAVESIGLTSISEFDTLIIGCIVVPVDFLLSSQISNLTSFDWICFDLFLSKASF